MKLLIDYDSNDDRAYSMDIETYATNLQMASCNLFVFNLENLRDFLLVCTLIFYIFNNYLYLL